MTNDELNKIKEVVREEVVSSEKRLRVVVKEEIIASEKRLINRIDESAGKVMSEVGKFMEDELFPMIDKKADKADIERLERKVDHYSDKLTDHRSRLNDLETLPIIAHELKAKKKK